MGFFSTILSFSGFGMGISIGLVIGCYLFIYFQPTDVKDLSIMRLGEIPLTRGRREILLMKRSAFIYIFNAIQVVIIATVTMIVVGLDRHTVFILIALRDLGLNSESLATLVKELWKEPPPTTTVVSCF